MKYILFISCCLLLCCCTFIGCKNTVTTSDLPKITIDLDRLKTIAWNDLFSEIELIPLETKDSCLLGIAYPFFTDTNYFMRDNTQQQLVCFDKNGKFMFKISNQGAGPEQYRFLSYATVHPSSGKILLIDSPYNIHEYTPTGEFIRKQQIDSLTHSIESVIPINNDTLLVVTGNEFTNYALYSYGQNRVLTEKKDSTFHFGLNKFYTYDNRLFHFKWFDNTIYELKGATWAPSYFLDFGKYNHAAKNYTDLFNYFYQHRHDEDKTTNALLGNFSFMLDRVQENSKYIFITLKKLNKDIEQTELLHIIYNKENNIASRIDSNSWSIGWWGNRLTEHDFITHISAAHKASLSPALLNAQNQKIYDQIDETDNPIIIRYKLK